MDLPGGAYFQDVTHIFANASQGEFVILTTMCIVDVLKLHQR